MYGSVSEIPKLNSDLKHTKPFLQNSGLRCL